MSSAREQARTALRRGRLTPEQQQQLSADVEGQMTLDIGLPSEPIQSRADAAAALGQWIRDPRTDAADVDDVIASLLDATRAHRDAARSGAEVTSEAFPTPHLALRSATPAPAVSAFADLQAEVAEDLRAALVRSLDQGPDARREALAETYRAARQWRWELACAQGGHALDGPHGIPAGADRFAAPITDDTANYDRVGAIGRLTENPQWDPATRTYVDGTATPASRVMAAAGARLDARIDAEAGPDADTLTTVVTLPSGEQITGNRLVRGQAGQAVADDLLARLAARGIDTSEVETGGGPSYTVTAPAASRARILDAAIGLLAVEHASPDHALRAWVDAAYLAYQAPQTKKGSDATIRVFLIAVGTALLGTAPVIPQDIDLRAYTQPQDQFVADLVVAQRSEDCPAVRTRDEMAATMTPHHGLLVSESDDDGGLVVLGHHTPRRTIAALNRHARIEWGMTSLVEDDSIRPGRAVDQLHQTWAALDVPCALRHGIDWVLAPVTEDTPGAFPVTLW